eukprot:COSAG01_NODE_526_length_15908_cov_6.178063_5_plen_76_part_00
MEIERHQSAGRAKDLSAAQKLIVELNHNTHQIVAIYKGMKKACSNLARAGTAHAGDTGDTGDTGKSQTTTAAAQS